MRLSPVAHAARLIAVLLLVNVTGGGQAAEPSSNLGFRTPPGFQVTLYADDDLAHDIFSMTIDSRGRVVVAGKDYVKILHDDDNDGRADRATLFSERPRSGAHGMCFVGNDLIATGDNSVARLRDADGDGKADGLPEIWTHLRHPEHGANGLVQGPDGWFYLICGNDAGVTPAHAKKVGSPIVNPDNGAVLRISPDGKNSQVLAHGFRNPYDIAFNAHGHKFTVDADGERDQHLPWYAPNRLFDIAVGQHHGWLLKGWRRSWNRPESYFDNVERLVEVGRGSPTGVAVYRHRQFPERYRGGVLSCCWTLGRVYHFPLTRAGATYTSRREILLETVGEVGFAPVDLAVGPRGDLFVAIGGRRTRGSVFRVRFVGEGKDRGAAALAVAEEAATPLDAVLRAPQPLAAWSRARWMPRAKQLGREPFLSAARDSKRSVAERMRAIEVLTELFSPLTPDETKTVTEIDQPAAVAARAIWSLSRGDLDEAAQQRLLSLTFRADPWVKRAAWEALLHAPTLGEDLPTAAWDDTASRDSRRVRAAAIRVAGKLSDEHLQSALPGGSSPAERLARLWCVAPRCTFGDKEFAEAAEIFFAAAANADGAKSSGNKDTLPAESRAKMQLEAVRLMQIALGDIRTGPTEPAVKVGYVAERPEQVGPDLRRNTAEKLAAAFPTGHAELDRELARLLGMLEAPGARIVDAIATRWTADSSPVDDVHYLFVAARLPGQRSTTATQTTANALAGLHHKMFRQERYPSRNWPTRVGEAFQELTARDPKLPAALASGKQFGLPEHALFVRLMKNPALRQQATRAIVRTIENDDGERELRWTSDLVDLAAVLPADEGFELLRDQWEDYALRDAILPHLARRADPADRSRLVDALSSVQSGVVEQAARTLQRLPPKADDAELAAALRALRRYSSDRRYKEERAALRTLLTHWTRATLPAATDNPHEDYKQIAAMLAKDRPALAERLGGSGAANAEAWRKRLAAIDWSAGHPLRGRAIYEKRACLACHGESGRLGPSLEGITGRFSRNDLFAAIADPNKNVSPLYQTTEFATRSGKIYHGLVIYQSPDGTLVQTGPGKTIRIAGEAIVSVRKSSRSLMPTGLLDDLTDRELADLYAYLQTLRKK